jgi:hypothetical protein
MDTLPPTQPIRRRTRFSRRVTVAAVLVVIALIAAGVLLISSRAANSASPGVAHAGSTPTVTGQASARRGSTPTAAAYSACMRSHGVPSFPDPNAQGKLYLKVTKGSALNPNSPQFQAAAAACKALAPRQTTSASNAQLSGQGLQFAACMRSHGEPNFPDPQVSNGHFMMSLPKGSDPNSPQFQSAMQACRTLMPGGGPGTGQ